MPRLSLGFNQRNFNGTRPTSAAAINMGTMRGKGSTSRMFIFCTQHSKNPSECINQFVNIAPPYIPPLCGYTFSGVGTLTGTTVSQYFDRGGTAKNICIEGYRSIGPLAFKDNKGGIRSVKIGDSVTEIGAYSFQNCPFLSNVILGSSVTGFSLQAFYLCSSLKNLKIPPSVTGSADDAFAGSGLTNVTIATNPQIISGITFTAGTTVTFFGKADVNIVYP